MVPCLPRRTVAVCALALHLVASMAPAAHAFGMAFQTFSNDPCSSHPCVHGTCSTPPTVPAAASQNRRRRRQQDKPISCKCAAGYTGHLCDHAVSIWHQAIGAFPPPSLAPCPLQQ